MSSPLSSTAVRGLTFTPQIQQKNTAFATKGYAATLSGNEVTDVQRLAGLDGDGRPYRDLEFWGDFQANPSAGTAPEWTALNGAVECLAGSAARQLTYVTSSPSPIFGARSARFEVASGDKFGSTTGERCEVRRGTPNGGFATGSVDGVVAYYQGAFQCQSPWTHPSGWEIFHQQHSFDARFGQAMLRLQTNSARDHFVLSLDTGVYPTLTDANDGTNAGTNIDTELAAFASDVWFIWRYGILWSSTTNGWLVFDMKRQDDSDWTRYIDQSGIATLPTVSGNATVGTLGDKIGFYRNDQAITNVVFQGGYRVGHSFDDVSFDTLTENKDYSLGVWQGYTNLVENSSWETNANGQTNSGGGTTTRTRVTTRSKFSNASLQHDTNGAASGQGTFNRKVDTTNYVVSPSVAYTGTAWYSGDNGDQTRNSIEWFDGGGASIQTNNSLNYSCRSEFRRRIFTFTAPSNAAKARFRTALSGTAATTFFTDGLTFTQSTFPLPHVATDNAAGGVAKAACRVQVPSDFLSATQGWIAARLRIGWDSSLGPGAGTGEPTLFYWATDSNNLIRLYYSESAGAWKLERKSGGSSTTATLAQVLSRGQYVTVIGAWTASTVKVASDLSLLQSTANTLIPTLPATFDFGSDGSANHINADCFWSVFGEGALSEDHVDILASYENTPPSNVLILQRRALSSSSATKGSLSSTSSTKGTLTPA